MNDVLTEFDWGELGETWWRQAAEQFRATEKQMKLACGIHHGLSQTGSAKLAGYGSDEDSIRQAAHRAAHSTAVKNLLAFASAEGAEGASGIVDKEERKLLLSNLARKGDPSTRIRAIEGLNKLDDSAAILGRSVDTDGFSEWRVVRDYLTFANGGPAICYLWLGQACGLSSLPLLHDVYSNVQKTDPDLWGLLLRRTTAVDRASIDRRIADPAWQLEARVKLWREIGIEIDLPNGVKIDSEALASPIADDSEQAVASVYDHFSDASATEAHGGME